MIWKTRDLNIVLLQNPSFNKNELKFSQSEEILNNMH